MEINWIVVLATELTLLIYFFAVRYFHSKIPEGKFKRIHKSATITAPIIWMILLISGKLNFMYT